MISAALAANCRSVLAHHERRRRSCTPSLRNSRHTASSETPNANATDAPSQLADPLGGGNSNWRRTRRRRSAPYFGVLPGRISGSCQAAPDRVVRPVPPPQSACATDQPCSGAPQARAQPRRCACPPGTPTRSWPVLPDAPPPSDCAPASSARLSAPPYSSAQSPPVPSDTSGWYAHPRHPT